jgi:PAS domain S-box-containing protein
MSEQRRPHTGRIRVRPERSLILSLAQIVLVAVAYYVAARLSLRFALVQRNVTPLWPPTGIALVVFLLMGRRMWPAVTLGALLVNLPITSSPLAAAVTAAGNTLAPLVGAALLDRVGFHREVDRPRDAVALVFLAALLAMTISATIGSATLVASGSVPAAHFLSTWGVWWTGDAMGVLIVAPFILSIGALLRYPRGGGTLPEGLALLLLVLAVSLALTRTSIGLMFLVVPLVGWAAWRFQLPGSASAALIASGAATVAVAHGAGPLAHGTLLQQMLGLQTFNATVAFTSVLFAALVTERMRSRARIEAAGVELEERVRQRTAALESTNLRLTEEVADRRAAERLLKEQERRLVEALDIAQLGSWEWSIEDGRMRWSDQMYEIHGHRPQAFDVTYELSLAHIAPEDLPVVVEMVAMAMGRGRTHDLPDIEYRIIRPDGSERILLVKAKLAFDRSGRPTRMVGTAQDVTLAHEASRDKRIAAALQRSLRPRALPAIPGFALSAMSRFPDDLVVGGDFYDVMQRPEGSFGLVIGDVMGRGPEAAAVMGIARQTVLVASMTEPRPSSILRLLNEALLADDIEHYCTVCDVRCHPSTDGGARLTVCSAGHPLPLVLRRDGSIDQVGAAGTLLGALEDPRLVDAPASLDAGDTLLMFTDGLIGEWSAALEHPTLAPVLRRCVGEEPQGVVDVLSDWAAQDGGADDLALLVLQAERAS